MYISDIVGAHRTAEGLHGMTCCCDVVDEPNDFILDTGREKVPLRRK